MYSYASNRINFQKHFIFIAVVVKPKSLQSLKQSLFLV